jgi:hypothetical protein
MRRQLNPLVRVRQIPFILLTAPHITGLNHENMNQKVEFLRGVGLDDDQTRTLLVRFPNCLLVTVENMASKVEGVKKLGLTDNDVVKLIRLVPQFLSFNMDSIHRKLQALDEMFGGGEAMRLWLSNVHLIGRNTEELRRTFEYLTKVVGMTPERITGNVNLIMRNVDRLVRPRYEYLTKIQSRDLEGVIWILLPETKFISRHPDYADFLACEFKP